MTADDLPERLRCGSTYRGIPCVLRVGHIVMHRDQLDGMAHDLVAWGDLIADASTAPPWTEASGERFTIWGWETSRVSTALRQVADALDADPDLVLYTFVNGPGEPTEAWLSTVQATVGRTVSTSTNPPEPTP